MVEMLPEKASSDPAENLQLRGSVIHGLQQNLMHGGRSLQMIPDTIKLIVAKGTWRKWVNEVTGRVEEFASFEEFVSEPLPDGLGAEIRTLKHLCRDDTGALDAIDRATARKVGVNQHTGLVNNINTRPQGTSNTYALRKLRKDRPDLHERVLAEEISPHAAMVEAGFRDKTLTVSSKVDKAARTLRRHFDPDELYQAMKDAAQ